MTIQQLQYLITTAKFGSITQAAEALYVSQSSISKSIKALEEELGIELINRNYAGISFTAAGLNFLRDSYILMEQYDRMHEAYSRKGDQIVSFGVSSQHYIFVMAAMTELAATFPEERYSFVLRENKVTEIVKDVLSRRTNLGFIYYYEMNKAMIFRELERVNLAFHPFCYATSHAYLSRSHPLAGEAEITLAQLAPYPYVYYDYDTDHIDFAEEVLSPANTKRSVAVTDRNTLFNIIGHSDGYSLGSGCLMEGFTPANIVAVPVHDSPGSSSAAMSIGWIAPTGQILSPLELHFLDLCRKFLMTESKDLNITLAEEKQAGTAK